MSRHIVKRQKADKELVTAALIDAIALISNIGWATNIILINYEEIVEVRITFKNVYYVTQDKIAWCKICNEYADRPDRNQVRFILKHVKLCGT